MCGIIGVVSLDRPPSLPALIRGRDLLAHRGPDGAGLWVGGGEGRVHVALGHRRLSILDLTDRGAQPLLLVGDGRAVPATNAPPSDVRAALVFNGEIYNYVELRAELEARGRRMASSGDTEVLLHAYAEWGERCVERLNGMFAFAIWDAVRRELFCARDRFGEKPFHYVVDERAGVFAFASEVKALVGAGLCRAELDDEAVYRYFRFEELAGAAQSIWRGVQRLLPATTLKVTAGNAGVRVSSVRYWDLPTDERLHLREAEAAERFGELFARSVRLRLRSDVRVGTSLSGGLDSSSVICQVHRLGAAGGQHAFTARMDDPRLDEGRYVDVVLRHTGIPGSDVTPTPELFLEELDRLFYHQEEPFPSTSIFASYLVNRLAKQEGVTVLLDGQGADELLAGYMHYPAVVLTDLARRGRALRWWSERHGLRARMGVDPVPPRAALFHWMTARSGRPRVLTIDGTHDVSFLSSDVRRRFADAAPRTVPAGDDLLRTRLHADLTSGHLQELLRYADRNSMAFSREVRLPFLDHELVEFVHALPMELLYRRGETKRVLRRAMRGVVPPEILDRRDKIGFTTPWERWWHGPLAGALRERLADAESALAPLVVPGAVAPGSAAALGVMALASSLRQMRAVAPRSRELVGELPGGGRPAVLPA